MFQILTESMLELDINGEIKKVITRPSDTLLCILREKLGLTAAKNSCENGDCNACTILVDGWPKKACLMLALEVVGRKVTTAEGLQNTPIQKAFLEKFALQCGYCTPGFVVNSHALVSIHPDADEETMKEWLQSNICRCTSYSEIRDAVKSVLSQ